VRPIKGQERPRERFAEPELSRSASSDVSRPHKDDSIDQYRRLFDPRLTRSISFDVCIGVIGMTVDDMDDEGIGIDIG
jgi:hypothetical protein